MADGDGKVTRSDPINQAKFYKEMAKETLIALNLMVNNYRMGQSTTKSIDYLTQTVYGQIPLLGPIYNGPVR